MLAYREAQVKVSGVLRLDIDSSKYVPFRILQDMSGILPLIYIALFFSPDRKPSARADARRCPARFMRGTSPPSFSCRLRASGLLRTTTRRGPVSGMRSVLPPLRCSLCHCCSIAIARASETSPRGWAWWRLAFQCQARAGARSGGGGDFSPAFSESTFLLLASGYNGGPWHILHALSGHIPNNTALALCMKRALSLQVSFRVLQRCCHQCVLPDLPSS